jgi:subtilisin family serine protease
VNRLLVAGLLAAAVLAAPASAFTPTDPLFPKQWYLAQDHAFDFWPEPPTTLAPVRVAIVDSGIDGDHPEFAGKIVADQSFVGGSAFVDKQGHGTFVAGEIAAAMDGVGIVGLAYPVQLIVAKVVRADGTIPLEAEAAAIRWAADEGANVINLSLGGFRDPLRPERDTYSRLEADAVAYASERGAVLVAAVGNADETYATPWPYASYPAALPHVIGVSALSHGGGIPLFSNRDAIYNDIAAPGQDIFSTFPRALTATRVGCVDQGYSDCAGDDYRHAEGTSFAAPQVSAAAAMLLAVSPGLRPEQVSTILERTADDANATNGCPRCAVGHDAYSGWGHLDVARALAAVQPGAVLPPADHYEPNDEAGLRAHTVGGATGELKATFDYWDDQIDVYRIHLTRKQKLRTRLAGPAGVNANLVLWKPGTRSVEDLRAQRFRAAQSARPGSVEQVAYRAEATGWYFVEVKLSGPGSGPYTLTYAKG